MSNLNQVNVNGTLYGIEPSDAITKAQLAQSVQASLDKADTALQTVPSTYRTAAAQDEIDDEQDTAIATKYTKPAAGIPLTDLASAVQNSLGKADTALQSADIIDKAAVIIDTASGPVASFPDGADNVPMASVVCEINPLQDLHGYDAPWPAGGTGVNLIPTGTDTSKGYVDQSYLKDDGTIGRVSGIAVSEYFEVKPSTVYRLIKTGEQSMISVSVCFYDSGKAYITGSGEKYNNRADFTVTSPATAAFARVSLPVSAPTPTTLTFWKNANLCPISGFTGLTLYHSGEDTSNHETYPISWETEAGTVYGGTLNVTTGVLTVTHWEFDMGSVTYTESSAYSKRFAALFPTGKVFPMWYSQNIPSGMLICSKYKEKSYQNVWVNGQNDICVYNAGDTMKFGVCEPTSQNAEDFRQAVTGQTVVYKLASPITYQLDPVTVTALLGANNLWHDANGSTNATYRADTTLYIGKKLSTITAMLTAYVEASMTASRAYAVNDFVNVNGQLYRVTAPIANGGTITPGTNATATTIGTQLTTIINS